MFLLIHIRLLQLRRQVSGAGIHYIALAACILLAIPLILYRQYATPGHGRYVAMAVLLLVLSAHMSRLDMAFVRKHLQQPVCNMFAEYLLFTLPLTLPCLLTPSWYLFPLLVPALYVIAAWRILPRQRTRLVWLSRLIRPADFEWLSGFRRSYQLLLPVLLLALLASPLRIAPLVFLWLAMAGISSFYQDCESLPLLRSAGRGPRRLLRGKILRHSRLLLLCFVPPLAINSLVCPDMLWINAGFLVLQLIALLCAILLKYSTYRPQELLRGNAVLQGMAVLSAAIPFLLPVPLLLCIRNYPRAIRNLQSYLHD